MRLSTQHLEAFFNLAAEMNFTRAARKTHLTQSAFSRRIAALEEELGTSVVVRGKKGVQLTETGSRLLKFADTILSLEEEFFFDISLAEKGKLGGLIRVAGYSSAIRPIIIPAMSPFLRDHPSVQVQFTIRDGKQCLPLLFESQVDFAIVNDNPERSDIEAQLLGWETFVPIRSKKYNKRNDVYLDTNPEDTTTEEFFRVQRKKFPRYRRSFMHDEEGILQGVVLGLGMAIKPKHTIPPKEDSIEILQNYVPLKKPVYLCFRKLRYYTRLHREIRETLGPFFKKSL